MSKSYEDQVREQIEQYRDTVDIHALPESFHLWSHQYIRPGMEEVFGVGELTAFYVEAFLIGAKRTVGVPQFLSLGCGDGSVEIAIAKLLVERGVKDFRFTCYDLSDILLGRFREAMPAELADHFDLVAQDLNTHAFNTQFDAVMANHSLHHMVDLEGIFRTVFDRLADGGVFVTNDMIGRNGHQRWPEARLFVDFFWPMLSHRQRTNAQLKRLESRFIDHDCSGEGFEGIRAEEILPVLVASGLKPWKFFGFGGMIDPFVDRGFGHGFDPKDPDDAFLIHRIALLNEILLDAGVIKPTIMLAYFVKGSVEEVCYRGRTLAASIRDPQTAPDWLAGALSDYANLPADLDYVFKSKQETPQAPQPMAADARQLVADQARRIAALEASTSWRITSPLRALVGLLRR